MGRVGCPETSITCYRYTLCNIPEERRCQLHRGGCLKSRIRCIIWLARKLYNPLRVVTLKIQCITTAVGTTNFIFTIKRRMFRPIKVIMRLFFFTMALHPRWAKASSLSRLHDHTQTHHTRWESSGRVISPTLRPLPDNTQHSQETDIHDPGEIRTHNPSKRVAADPRLRQRSHWDQQSWSY